jgi:hypothetical protein
MPGTVHLEEGQDHKTGGQDNPHRDSMEYGQSQWRVSPPDFQDVKLWYEICVSLNAQFYCTVSYAHGSHNLSLIT